MNVWRSTHKWFIIGAIVIASIGLVVYWDALRIGFWTDDYDFLETAGRLGIFDYLRTYFDPRVQWHWYRPMQGMAWWIGYALFRTDSVGYHAGQIFLHILNALWLYALIKRMTQRWYPAFLAALLYVTLPAYGLAVYWPGVADPLVAFFFLGSLWLWIEFLKCETAWRFLLAYGTFVLALLAKETAVGLPIVLFLVDRWLVRQPASAVQLFKRYTLFVFALAVYGLFELNVLMRGVFTQQLGYGVGNHILDAFVHHLITLVFPWGIEAPWSYLWLTIVIGIFVFATYRRMWQVLFVGAIMIITMLPILPFPSTIAFAPRYLYLPLMSSMIGWGFLLNGLQQTFFRHRWRRLTLVISTLGIVVLLGWQSIVTAEGALNFGVAVRAERLRFRSIFQTHPSFPPGTLLYFIKPDYPNLSGMIFVRYGAQVTVAGTNSTSIVNLRAYPLGIIFYRDEQDNWHEQTVDRTPLDVRFAPMLPASFEQPLMLNHIELANQRIRRGDALIVLMQWQSSGRINKDYTLFFHLIDANGNRVDGVDKPPRDGEPPTSNWRAGEIYTDEIVLPIAPAMPLGEYTIEMGFYDRETMQRLVLIDSNGQPISDRLSMGSIWIVE